MPDAFSIDRQHTVKPLTILKQIAAVAPVLVLLSSCGGGDRMTRIAGKAQGTYYSVLYYDRQERSLREGIDSLLAAFDMSASLWVETSVLNRLNKGEDSVLDQITVSLLEKSIAMNKFTEGAFDCRVGALVNAWGFGAKDKVQLDSATVDSLLTICNSEIGVKAMPDNTKTLWRSDSRTEIDFNAIAQGYSVDLLASYLDKMGIDNYLVDVGGEIIAKGGKKNGHPWTVGIEKPAADSNSIPQAFEAVNLRNAALVTSGNYRKYYEKDGIRYSHTIDPQTGYPVNHSLLSVSVIDSTAWRADALATAFMVMGLDKAKRFLSVHPEIKYVYFIYDEKGQYKTYATAGMEKLIADFTSR